jgi:RNA polymerase sigma-70 factor (ECF subfamily)
LLQLVIFSRLTILHSVKIVAQFLIFNFQSSINFIFAPFLQLWLLRLENGQFFVRIKEPLVKLPKRRANLIVEGYLPTMDIKEKALLYRAHAGDRGAAGILYEQYYRDIYSYVFYRVNDQATAEDISAEVFIRMIRQLPNYLNHGKPFISWLYGLARKIIAEHKEDQNQPAVRMVDIGNGSIDVSIDDEEALSCFQRALQHLPERQKELIIHRFVEGRTVKDIADLVNQSERSVRTLQYRALQALQDALKVENCL